MKRDRLYVTHILECIERIERYIIAGKEAFFSDSMIQDAVIRNLQILAESSMRITERLRMEHPGVPWKALAGFRNVAVHDYLGLDLHRIWDIASVDLSALKDQVERIAEGLSGAGLSDKDT